MNESKLQSKGKTAASAGILTFMKRVGVASSSQIARCWFSENGSPTKRAREFLYDLVERNILDTYYVPGQCKLYRLTKGYFGEGNRPSFTKRLSHRLALGNTLIDLMQYEEPSIYVPEYRQKFDHIGCKYEYAPDIITRWLGKRWWTFEVQITPWSSKQWSVRWEKHLAYWKSGAYQEAPWQPEKKVRPQIVVISNQTTSTVTEGGELLNIIHVKSIHDLFKEGVLNGSSL